MKKYSGFRIMVLAMVVVALCLSMIAVYRTFIIGYDELPFDESLLAIQAAKNEIYSRFFEIFAIVATLMGALTAILGVGAYTLLRARFEEQMRLSTLETVRIAQARTLAVAFNEHAFSWWRRYEPPLQTFLSNPDALSDREHSECLENVAVALDLASHGLEPFDDLSEHDKERFMTDAIGRGARARLLNQILYSSTAQLLLTKDRPSVEMVDELEEIATELYELALDRNLAKDEYNWWEAIETVAFFRVHVGEKFDYFSLLVKGKSQLRYLTNGKRLKRYLKPLPDSIEEQVRAEYTANGFGHLI